MRQIIIAGFFFLTLINPLSGGGVSFIDATALSTGNVIVNGRLGFPLGTVCRIFGEFYEGSRLGMKAYDGVMLIKVAGVNGKPLKKSLILNFTEFSKGAISKIKPGRKFKAFAYETGQFKGIPSEAFKYVSAVSTTDYFFETSIVILIEIQS